MHFVYVYFFADPLDLRVRSFVRDDSREEEEEEVIFIKRVVARAEEKLSYFQKRKPRKCL